MAKDSRKTIYVRNLPYAAAQADVEAFFGAVGRVVDIRRSVTQVRFRFEAFMAICYVYS